MSAQASICSFRRPVGRELHGMTGTPEYNIYRSMLSRCLYPGNDEYASYGGRGIKVCDEWFASFKQFLRDVGPRPSPQHSIDRIDNDGDYEPGNVKWSTRFEQQNNTQKSVHLTLNGQTFCVREWARRLGMNHRQILIRKHLGMSDEDCLSRESTWKLRRKYGIKKQYKKKELFDAIQKREGTYFAVPQ